MTAKEFFKSTSFKCIAVLLSILLVCGVLLTLCNAVFKVTEKDLRERAISQIYGQTVDATEQDLSTRTTEYTYSTIQEAYYVEFTDKKTNEKVYNYLVKVTGKGGFGGDVGCYVAVNLASDKKTITGIYSVQIISAEGESFLSNITSAHLKQITKIVYTDGYVYELGWVNGGNSKGKDFINTGASMTMRAISNAVNGAINLVKEITTGAVTAEPEPVPEPEPPTIYDDFLYTDYIDKANTSHKFENGEVVYDIKTTGLYPAEAFELTIKVGSNGKITDFVIDDNGSTYDYEQFMMPDILDGTYIEGKGASDFLAVLGEGAKDETLSQIESGATSSDHATKSNFLCLYASLFATANYDAALASAWSYSDYIDLTSTTTSVEGDVAVLDIKTTGLGMAEAFELTIKVGSNGKITDFVIDDNGSTYDYEQFMMPDILDGTYIEGKGASDFLAVLGEGAKDETLSQIESGATSSDHATKSNFLCLYASLFAAANYDLAIILGGNA